MVQWKEEIANAITHGIGFLLSIVGLILLITRSVNGDRDLLFLISVIVFGSSMILLYLCSTLLHSIHFQKTKRLFTILDHASIYVLIAGTYTPFLLVTLRGRMGWILLAVIWSIAIAGIIFKSIFADRFSGIATIGYLIMGWLILFVAEPIFQALPTIGFALLVSGGILYSVGTIFFLWDKLPFSKKLKLPFSHAIWHMFVLGGSLCMFFCVLLFID